MMTYICLFVIGACQRSPANPKEKLSAEEMRRTAELFNSITNSQLQDLRDLIRRGADVSYRLPDGQCALLIAAHAMRKDVVELLIQEGVPVNVASDTGWTPLHIAAEKGTWGIASVLLKNKAKVDARDKDNETPLHLALRRGHDAIGLALIDSGANIQQAASDDHDPPIVMAAGSGCVECTRRMMAKRADVNAASDIGWSALHAAAAGGHEEIVAMLLKKGTVVNRRTELKETPLLLAVAGEHLSVVRLLISRGADPNIADCHRASSLHWATLRKDRKYAELCMPKARFPHPILGGAARGDAAQVRGMLGSNKALWRTRDGYGWSPVHWAAAMDCGAVLKLLLDAGADVDDPTPKWRSTPLRLAAAAGSMESAKILLARGARLNAQRRGGTTPLHVAAANGHLELCKVFLDNGARVNAANANGTTPLHFAAGRGEGEVARLLCGNGADALASNKRGETALHIAASGGHVEVARAILLASPEALNARDKRRRTPLETAVETYRPGLVRYLVSQGADMDDKDDQGQTLRMRWAWRLEIEKRRREN